MKKSKKMKIRNKIALFAAAIVVGLSQVNAAPTLSQQIDSLPALEVPAFAVQTVIKSEKEQRLDNAVKVVRTIAVQNEKALVPSVVSIVRAFPEFAPTLATEASRLSPNQAKQIAIRVAQAAPNYSSDIAFNVISAAKMNSGSAVQVAEALVRISPQSSDLTLSAVANRVPSARQTLTSRFPNAVLFVFPSAISSTSGSLLQREAQKTVDELQEIIDNGGTLTPEQQQEFDRATNLLDKAQNQGDPTPYTGTIVDGSDPNRYSGTN